MPKRILLVEDRDDHVDRICGAIHGLADVDVVDSLEEVLAKVIGPEAYDAALLDMRIYEHRQATRATTYPGEVQELKWGIAALKHILQHMDASRLYVFTAYTDKVLGELERLGVIGRCITKQTSEGRLVERVKRLLRE